jgi:hypothetical protein
VDPLSEDESDVLDPGNLSEKWVFCRSATTFRIILFTIYVVEVRQSCCNDQTCSYIIYMYVARNLTPNKCTPCSKSHYKRLLTE